MTIARITAPHFCAGVIIGERAAPIVSYMRTWSVGKIVMYCAKKAWLLELLP